MISFCEKDVRTECLNKILPKPLHSLPPTSFILIRLLLIDFCKVYPFRPLLHSNMQLHFERKINKK